MKENNLEPVKEKPIVDKTVGKLKINEEAKPKPKPKKLTQKKEDTVKIDLNKKTENAVQEQEPKKEMLQPTSQNEEKREENQVELQEVGSTHEESKEPTEQEKEVTVIEEIKEDNTINNDLSTNVTPVESNLPENVEKLVSFLKDTGGNIEDYVKLNKDYSNVSDDEKLIEYYKQTKPHLNLEEINFLLEDQFNIDEEYDEDKTVRKKRLAKKEEVAKAEGFLEEIKKTYYDEIKARPTVNNETKKAIDFFNRYQNDQQRAKEQHQEFSNLTQKYFNEDFKGFDFNLGEKKFRYKVKNPADVANAQTNITDFFKTFLNEDGSVKDHSGYHKAIYAARNMDSIANHFYEQGKADAVKDVVSKSKNINNTPRQVANSENVMVNGLRIKSVSGVDSNKLKVKSRKV